jgi:hypothetical protein
VSALLAAVTASVVTPAAAVTPVSSCQTGWGSLGKARLGVAVPQLTNVRAGRHTCFDRLVLDLDGKIAGYWINYVPEVPTDESHYVPPLRGGAKIKIIAQAPAYYDQGTATYRPANHSELVNVAGSLTFRQVAWAGSGEGGTSSIGLGVRARLPFRVSIIDGPNSGSRLVIDVAHSW